MKKYLIILLLSTNAAFAQKLTAFVDPFIGTGGHGHTYPGAVVPFGMVQLSPDNGKQGWDWCSGYNYSSNTIAGFSHTHLSGTGIGDWCDISVTPMTDSFKMRDKLILQNFSHANEKAKPGYYSVQLDNGIRCELTATTRNGIHRYTFPATQKQNWVRFDMGFTINWDSCTNAIIQIVDDSTIAGYRFSTGWAKGQKVFFAARFSQKINAAYFIDAQNNAAKIGESNKVKLAIAFQNNNQPLIIRTGLSSVSTDKAVIALQESDAQSFETIANKADQLWEAELQKIKVETNTKADKIKFYTALYHTCLAPSMYADIDGAYQTHNNKMLQVRNSNTKYNVYSLWDTFRGLHPLFTLTQTNRLPGILNSMLDFYEDNGLLPVWDLSSWEANTMTGYHSIPVLADAILKGIANLDAEKIYAAMLKSANQNQRGTPAYKSFGYVPQDKHGWSVTITLEYAFDDWCIAQVAKKLGKEKDYQYYLQRSESYAKLFDSKTGFMRARDSKGNFVEPFDPYLSEHGFDGQYIEGTAWQHSFFVPHAIPQLANLYGGKEKLIAKLDELFATKSELHGDNASIDVTGMIGQYAHGNEPSHHIIYMYTALGRPDKAARQILKVTDSLYKANPEGLSGNEDCGQMSAWLVWTMLGMYPMNPASGEYVFGYPLIKSAVIALPNQKKITITVSKKKAANKTGIAAILLNGKSIPVSTITHQQLLNGGSLQIQVY